MNAEVDTVFCANGCGVPAVAELPWGACSEDPDDRGEGTMHVDLVCQPCYDKANSKD